MFFKGPVTLTAFFLLANQQKYFSLDKVPQSTFRLHFTKCQIGISKARRVIIEAWIYFYQKRSWIWYQLRVYSLTWRTLSFVALCLPRGTGSRFWKRILFWYFIFIAFFTPLIHKKNPVIYDCSCYESVIWALHVIVSVCWCTLYWRGSQTKAVENVSFLLLHNYQPDGLQSEYVSYWGAFVINFLIEESSISILLSQWNVDQMIISVTGLCHCWCPCNPCNNKQNKYENASKY